MKKIVIDITTNVAINLKSHNIFYSFIITKYSNFTF